MKNDHLICGKCDKIFIEIDDIHDTRVDNKFRPRCPYCGATLPSINIELEVERFNKQMIANRIERTSINMTIPESLIEGYRKELKDRGFTLNVGNPRTITRRIMMEFPKRNLRVIVLVKV